MANIPVYNNNILSGLKLELVQKTSNIKNTDIRRDCGATPCGGSRPWDSFLSRFEGLVYAEGAPTRFMIASCGVLSEGYGHDRPGVCLGDGQTEAEGVPSQCGRGDALLWRMPPYLT